MPGNISLSSPSVKLTLVACITRKYLPYFLPGMGTYLPTLFFPTHPQFFIDKSLYTFDGYVPPNATYTVPEVVYDEATGQNTTINVRVNGSAYIPDLTQVLRWEGSMSGIPDEHPFDIIYANFYTQRNQLGELELNVTSVRAEMKSSWSKVVCNSSFLLRHFTNDVQVFNLTTNLATDPSLPGFGVADFSIDFGGFSVEINDASVGYLHDAWQVSYFDDGSLQLPPPAVSSGADTTVSIHSHCCYGASTGNTFPYYHTTHNYNLDA